MSATDAAIAEAIDKVINPDPDADGHGFIILVYSQRDVPSARVISNLPPNTGVVAKLLRLSADQIETTSPETLRGRPLSS